MRVWDREFNRALMPAAVDVEPVRWSVGRVGGFEAAQVRATGEVWPLLGWLRRPVQIVNQGGVVVWSGYVSEVTVQAGAIAVGASLDTLGNDVRVLYTDVPTGDTVGTAAETAAVQDALSIEEYGQRSVALTLDQAETATAEAYRDAMLTLLKYPRPTVAVEASEPGVAWLECRGWWTTLDWLFYANSWPISVPTTDQIVAMVANYRATNDWFRGCDVVDASGVSENQYRDGQRTHRDEIEDLLVVGTSTGARLRAWVDGERWIRVEAEVEPTVPRYQLGQDGGMTTAMGLPVEPGFCPGGEWLGLRDVLPGVVPSTLSALSPMLVERCEYDAASGVYTIEPGGVGGPWAALSLI